MGLRSGRIFRSPIRKSPTVGGMPSLTFHLGVPTQWGDAFLLLHNDGPHLILPHAIKSNFLDFQSQSKVMQCIKVG